MTAEPYPRSAPWRRGVWLVVRVCLLVVCGLCLLLLFFQDRLLYHPRAYPAGVPLRPGVEAIRYPISAGPQVGWWKPPAAGNTRWWLACAGNASLARTWLDVLETPDGLLLVDYPGFGENTGKPGPAAMREACLAAVAQLRILHPELASVHGVLGHSLGAAAVLQVAADLKPQRIVIVAPFTRMLDMAQRVVGWPWCQLLLDRWDNRASLARIDAATPIDLWHGDADTLIPVSMARSLTAEFPAIRLHLVAGAGHDDILGEIADQLLAPSLDHELRMPSQR